MRYSFHLVIDGTRAVAFAKLAQACTLSTDTARCWATAPPSSPPKRRRGLLVTQKAKQINNAYESRCSS